MKLTSDPIVLTEYKTVRVPDDRITSEEGLRLRQEYNRKIVIDKPWAADENEWEITAQGWVGYIPFSERLSFFLEPKIPLQNLFGMWEYAYRLKSFQILPDLYQSNSLQDFYEQLANVYARMILDRGRKGYYRAYISRSEELSCLRGKMDVRRMVSKPWEPRPFCYYQENTADVVDNQILAWAMYSILRSGFCSERVLPLLRRCHRNLSQVTSLKRFLPSDCVGRFYNRLNEDYQPLHALSRFFLENTGPSHVVGENTMLPFLVNMWGLFEMFVAEWLRLHLPPGYELSSQDKMVVGETGKIEYRIDLVINLSSTGEAVFVLDTKYKKAETPSPADINQIYTYAGLKGCQEGVLIYPEELTNPAIVPIGDVRIRALSFSLNGDLEGAGQKFLSELFSGLEQPAA